MRRDERSTQDMAGRRGTGSERSTAAFIASPRLKHLPKNGMLLLIGASICFGFWAKSVDIPGQLHRVLSRDESREVAHQFNVTWNGFRGPVEFKSGEILPLKGKTFLMNIWLQNCPDCIPAFRAFRDFPPSSLPNIPVVNISYGSELNMQFAKKYGLDSNLIADQGSGIVLPLRIRTFTTVLVDADGVFRWSGTPAEPGFLMKLQGAYESLRFLH